MSYQSFGMQKGIQPIRPALKKCINLFSNKLFSSNISTQLVIGYLILSIPIGTLLIFFDKEPSRNDFPEHWARAQQVASFQFIATPDPSGTGNYGSISDNGTFFPFNNTAINSPFVYLPSIIGMGHLRISCFLTLLFSVACISASIMLAKKYCLLIFAAAILPTFFLSSIYPTADAVSNAISFLWIAYMLYLLQQQSISLNEIIMCTLLASALGQIKTTCLCLLLLLTLPAIQTYRNNKILDLRFAIPLFAGVLSSFIWMNAVKDIPPSAVTTVEQYSAAKQDVFNNPDKVFTSLFVTLFNPLDRTNDIHDTGRNIQFFTGAEHTQLPLGTMFPILFAFVILVLFGSQKAPTLSSAQKFTVITTIIVFYALTCVGLIVSWGGVSLGSYASGLQSRYFIPIIIPLVLCIPKFELSAAKTKTVKVFCLALILWSYIGLLFAHIFVFPWQS